MTTIPTTEPTSVQAGDTLKWNRMDLSDYPATSSWELSYSLRGPQEIDLSFGSEVTASGAGFAIVVAAATTAGWEPGTYWWQARVTDGSEIYTVDSGTLEVVKDLSLITGEHDGRTHAKKTLDALEAVIQGRASRSDLNYTIAGRSLQQMSHRELRDEWSFWRGQVAMEQRAEKIANGEGHSGRIKVRFT